jgi:hypothetical protein
MEIVLSPRINSLRQSINNVARVDGSGMLDVSDRRDAAILIATTMANFANDYVGNG